jgi:hypothetical protein
MTRDHFYQQILAGLRARLDPELFERCAAALLRTIYPTLVPVRGGSDAGMDGACADGDGPAFPLITTVDGDVIGNLRKNLQAYMTDGRTRRHALLATSQEISSRRRKNLEDAAAEQLALPISSTARRVGAANC